MEAINPAKAAAGRPWDQSMLVAVIGETG